MNFLLLTCFTPCSNVSIVNFEYVIAGWVDPVINLFSPCIEIKIKLNFYFQTFCGASKCFSKVFLVRFLAIFY